jgi:hypothetical protein
LQHDWIAADSTSGERHYGVTLLETRLAWQKQVRKPDRQAEFCVHLLATFTINPLEPYLGMALLNEGFAAALSVGPFDQVSQQLLQATTFASHDVVVVWPRLEDAWGAGPLPLIDGDSAAALRSFTELGLLCVQQAAALGVTVVVVLPALPDLRPLGVGDAGNLFGMGASSSSIREALRATVAGSPGVLVFDAEEVIRTIGSRSARDDRRFAAASPSDWRGLSKFREKGLPKLPL